MKKLKITVGEKVYDVTVEVLDEGSTANAPLSESGISSASVAAAPVSVSPPKPSSITGGGPGDVLSPLSGKVVEVMVKPGTQIQEGTQVATVEAMKMNTYVFAPKSGQVTEVLVSPGDGVEEGQVLVRIG